MTIAYRDARWLDTHTSLEIEEVESVHDLVVSNDVGPGSGLSVRSVWVPGSDESVVVLSFRRVRISLTMGYTDTRLTPDQEQDEPQSD